MSQRPEISMLHIPTEQLLPCPFCGAAAKIEERLDRSGFDITCSGRCGGEPYVTRPTLALGVSVWNKRAPIGPETFGSKLRAMRADLRSIVSRMNVDRNEEIADLAQSALKKVGAIEDAIDDAFGDARDLPWDWEPQTDEERDEAR